MDKIGTYFLRDKNGYIVVKVVVKVITKAFMDAECYECTGWDANKEPIEWSYVADVYCKWDACTHWWFRGEEYHLDKKVDGYYHLCGGHSFSNHIRTMCFVLKLANMKMEDAKYYFDNELTEQLIDFMLNGYSIIKQQESEGA